MRSRQIAYRACRAPATLTHTAHSRRRHSPVAPTKSQCCLRDKRKVCGRLHARVWFCEKDLVDGCVTHTRMCGSRKPTSTLPMNWPILPGDGEDGVMLSIGRVTALSAFVSMTAAGRTPLGSSQAPPANKTQNLLSGPTTPSIIKSAL